MKKLLKSFLYALNGIGVAFRDQRNLKVQATIALLTIGAGFYFNITPMEWCLILLSIGLVMGLEMVNSAIEDVVNLVTKERSSLAGKVKDMAAGAVLIFSAIAVVVGVIIFRKYLMIG